MRGCIERGSPADLSMMRLLRLRPKPSPRRGQKGSTLAIVGVLVVLGILVAGQERRPEASAATSLDVRSSPTSLSRPSAASRTGSVKSDMLVVTASLLRLRSTPNAAAAIHGSASQGTFVASTGTRSGAWYEVRLRDGTQGWMHGDYLHAAVPADNAYDLTGEAAPTMVSARPRRDLNPAVRADVIGRATVTDGDTIVIGGTRIRLDGLDAPERRQACLDANERSYPCGGQAANALDTLIARRTVACRSEGTDRYDRMLGTCWVAAELPKGTGTRGTVPATRNDDSLNERMVAAGWALAYRRYSTAYVSTERRAQADGRGIWQGAHTPPWDYRRGQRLMSTAAPAAKAFAPSTAASSRNCAIKGNISKSGRIYHVPGSRWYDRTRIDTGRGERWFCSEAEARAAGWRASRG